ncbi:hypothetical protein [Methylophilus aquaticus]|uniref:Uncharacterized protein n=1 Tax=Methylophilus aquaticus TaxID=1971610 RepID=A0ABT9JRX0_9PROT|nr:hypothetical protein [Methylophilus aquaticus]MDP8567276.1 hypothetical protein [Methylophilus aquaticus]
MKSVFKNMFTCSALILATFTANATADHGGLVDVLEGVLAHADLPMKDGLATYAFAFALEASTKGYASMTLDKVASSDDDQADSTDADSMLA